MNVILADCNEHVYGGENTPVKKEPMGAYLLRGDMVAVVGEIDSHGPSAMAAPLPGM